MEKESKPTRAKNGDSKTASNKVYK